MPIKKHLTYIGLGANLGNPQATIRAAITELGALPSTELMCASSLYSSAPIDADGGDYINAVVQLCTQLAPSELHAELQALESRFGRTRDYKNAPRTLDLDLLLYEQQVIHTDTLQIPHPRMTQRAFVIMPLLEITPEINIPGLGAARSLLPHLQHQKINMTNGNI